MSRSVPGLGRIGDFAAPEGADGDGARGRACKVLAADGALDAVIRVPDAVGDLRLRADLRARQTLTSVSVEAPREGRVTSRINWLLRQLGDAPDDLRVEASYPNARETVSVLLAQAREEPSVPVVHTGSQARAAQLHPHARAPDGIEARKGRRLVRTRDA